MDAGMRIDTGAFNGRLRVGRDPPGGRIESEILATIPVRRAAIFWLIHVHHIVYVCTRLRDVNSRQVYVYHLNNVHSCGGLQISER